MIPQLSLRDGCRVLVTGGAGFIGSHLADKLLHRGCRVDILDDFSTGLETNLDRQASGMQVTTGCVTNFDLVAGLAEQADCIVHLAAAVGALNVHRDQLRTLTVNVDGTRTVLSAAAARRIPVLVASSSEVYGPGAAVPCCEDDLRTFAPASVPRASYGISKAAAEQIALGYFEQSDVPVVIARLFNTIGVRQHSKYGMVVPRFAKQAVSRSPLTVFGDGTQTRCFVDVHDVLDALIGLLECPRAFGRAVNIGATHEVSMLELAKLILERAGRDPEDPENLRFVPHEEVFGRSFTDTSRRVPSVALVQKLIGWSPRIDLEESLRQVLQAVSESLGQ